MKTESAKRKIFKLLHLAADSRGNAAQSRAAAALAKRLMRAHGWSQDDLRDGALPTDATERIILPCQNGEEHRFLAVTKIVMTRFQSITSEARSAAISSHAIIDLRGAKAEIKQAVTLWHWLNANLTQHWQEEQEANAIGQFVSRRLTSVISFANISTPPPPDEPSWLKGVAEGYWVAEQQDARWRAALKEQEEKKQLPPPKPKRRRRCLPRKNPLALAVIPKPVEVIDVKPMEMTVLDGLKAKIQVLEEIDSPEPEPEPQEKHKLDDFSYRRGWQLGRGLYQKIKDQ